jgi:hypothetical protein
MECPDTHNAHAALYVHTCSYTQLHALSLSHSLFPLTHAFKLNSLSLSLSSTLKQPLTHSLTLTHSHPLTPTHTHTHTPIHPHTHPHTHTHTHTPTLIKRRCRLQPVDTVLATGQLHDSLTTVVRNTGGSGAPLRVLHPAEHLLNGLETCQDAALGASQKTGLHTPFFRFTCVLC